MTSKMHYENCGPNVLDCLCVSTKHGDVQLLTPAELKAMDLTVQLTNEVNEPCNW